MKNNICAIYARYSNIDKKTETNEYRSITNQIKILTEYAIEQGFRIYKSYFDHHISGTTFSRPGFNQMMEDAKARKFNIILVKDLSRFGRNYIDAGKYLIDVLPSLDIRFISVNDNYDSDINDDTSELAIRNVLNHLYAKDIGKKIRKTYNLKLHKSMLRTKHYGYIIKNKIATIYEPEAEIVRRIFNEANDDKSLVDIYLDLNKDNIASMGKSFYIKNNQLDKIGTLKEDKWDLANIKIVLQDEFYTGTSINAKGHVNSTLDRNIVVENTHPAIISKELFESVNNKLFKSENYLIKKERLKHMIYCKKCLARTNLNKSKASIAVTEIDNKLYYVDYNCKVKYPYDLFNKRLYDELLDRFTYIYNHKLEYIDECLIDLTSVDGKALEYNKIKQKAQTEFSTIFESYINGEISEDSYKNKVTSLKQTIDKCDKFIKNFKIDETTRTIITNKVNKFINSFYESDVKLQLIKEFVNLILYDPRNGKIELVLKFEDELNLNRVKLENLVIPERIRRKDFDLSEITISILKEHPYIKIKDILAYANEIWEGFNYDMIKRNIQKLTREGVVVMEETHNKMADGYCLKDTPEDFDYKGMKLTRILKECYKYLYYNPKASYNDIAKQFSVSQSQAREYVLALRNANAFDDPRFDKNYIPYGSAYSIYTGHIALDKNIEEQVKTYYIANPKTSRTKLAEIFNISEGRARRIIDKINKGRREVNA